VGTEIAGAADGSREEGTSLQQKVSSVSPQAVVLQSPVKKQGKGIEYEWSSKSNRKGSLQSSSARPSDFIETEAIRTGSENQLPEGGDCSAAVIGRKVEFFVAWKPHGAAAGHFNEGRLRGSCEKD
jgi:hypothetical protein